MDHRDEMAEYGTYLKSLPDAEIDQDKMELTFEIEDDDIEPGVYSLRLKWEVCPTCDGRGKHTNPSIDAHGITEDEFAEDPGFKEEYMRGAYDVMCYECKGRTTTLCIDEEHSTKEAVARANQWFTDETDYRSECAMERRMGC